MLVTSGEDKLFYEDVGQGDAVVLIPGLGTTHLYFKTLTEALSKKYRILALDLRGVGQSSSQAKYYSMEGWAQDVARFCRSSALLRSADEV